MRILFYILLVYFFISLAIFGVLGFNNYNKINEKLNKYQIINFQKYNSIVDPNKKTLKVKYINLYAKLMPFSIDRILKEKYNVQYVTNNDYHVIIDGPHGKETIWNNNAIKIYVTPESDVPEYEKYDLSIGSSLIENEKYIRVPFAFLDQWRGANFKSIELDYDRPVRQGKCDPSKRYFGCTLFGNNRPFYDGVNARIRLFHHLSLYKFVLSGGAILFTNNFDRNPYDPGVVSIEDTTKFFSNCKFILAYENTNTVEGYITEKPFQAYLGGGIPVYYGHKSVLSDSNKEAVIFAEDFKSEEDLVEYIKKVDNDDELYCKIWNNNIINKQDQGFNAYYTKLREKLHSLLEDNLPKVDPKFNNNL